MKSARLVFVSPQGRAMLDAWWTLRLDLGWSLEVVLDSHWIRAGLSLASVVDGRTFLTHAGLTLDSR